ncbi:hypothetical protein THAOC_02561 [Thalassiosira oceanica]|uniref:Uncharacterized protein n=1 Tax=Thalassiosira oceanica TaxID=159749 RepID=K0TQA5_THAOC|nr:hypothetical protein THAOC_02561 [Thalassiosira oceanica]|eukprot:EJK75707.1 hypothetical protein THAOC_02561 [Thalassiosira oceanica]
MQLLEHARYIRCALVWVMAGRNNRQRRPSFGPIIHLSVKTPLGSTGGALYGVPLVPKPGKRTWSTRGLDRVPGWLRRMYLTALFLLANIGISSIEAWSTSERLQRRDQSTVLSSLIPEYDSQEGVDSHGGTSTRRGVILQLGGTSLALSRVCAANCLESDGNNAPLSLLSSYKPSEFKTLPSAGRIVSPPAFLPPINERATYRYAMGRNAWALEQLLAFQNVTATIRTNVVKLDGGGLWVHNPLYPTGEYCALLDELGTVTDVALGSNALEHKAAMRSFMRRYPGAQVWVSPGQYGPFGSCGDVTFDMTQEEVENTVRMASKTLGYKIAGIIPRRGSSSTSDAVAQKYMLPRWAGEAGEFDFFCSVRRSSGKCGPRQRDSVCAQPIFSTYFDDPTIDDPTFWPRTVLQAVFLPLRQLPSGIPDHPIFPGYKALEGRVVRAPILRAFADARAPDAVRDWVSSIVQTGGFDRILTAHFASPINVGPKEFELAFAHLYDKSTADDLFQSLPIYCQDWSTLNSLNSFIDDNALGAKTIFDYRRGCKAE